MRDLVKATFGLIFVLMWLAGIVLAKGFWATTFAIFSPYGLYLVVEKTMTVYKILQ